MIRKSGHRFSEKIMPTKKSRARHRALVSLDLRNTMRAEIERLVEEIKQSVGLLRRHL
jgi:hypothetical protein